MAGNAIWLMGFFLQEIGEKCCGAFKDRSDVRYFAKEIRIDDERYPGCHGERSALSPFQKQLDGCGRKSELPKSRITADCSNVIISIVSVRSSPVRRRHEPFSDQITNLPLGDAGESYKFANVH